MKGFGTVVTGTLVAGSLGTGDEVEILPEGRRARVRGLQVHGETVTRVLAGSRAAANLAGVETNDVARGDVIAAPGTMAVTSMLDVELRLLPDARPLADGARVRVHLASAEALARVRLLGADAVAPGASALAQLRLARPVATGRGDRLVLRSPSPALTIGGAVVLDPLPPRRRARDRAAVERLRGAASDAEAALALASEAGASGVEAARLAARLTLPQATLLAGLAGAPGLAVLGQPAVVVAETALEALGARVLEVLARYHREEPLRAAMPREALRERVGPAAVSAFERAVSDLAASGRILARGDGAALAGHAVRLDAGEEAARRRLVDAATAAGLAGIEVRALEAGQAEASALERVARVLVAENVLARVGERGLVARAALDALVLALRERFARGARLEVAALKELTGLTRKHAIPLLEYLDRERVTRRAGADRILL